MLRLSVLLAMAVALVTAVPTNRPASDVSEEFGEDPEYNFFEKLNVFLQAKIQKEMRILGGDILPNIHLSVPFQGSETGGLTMSIDQPKLSCEDYPRVTVTDEVYAEEESNRDVIIKFSLPHCQVSGTTKITSYSLDDDDQTAFRPFSVDFVLPLPTNETTVRFLVTRGGDGTWSWNPRGNHDMDDLNEAMGWLYDASQRLEALVDFMERVDLIEGVNISPRTSVEMYGTLQSAFWREIERQSGQLEMLYTIYAGTKEDIIAHFVNVDDGEEDEGEYDEANNIDG